MAEKHLKNTKKIGEKQVRGEGEIKKGEKGKGGEEEGVGARVF